MDSPENQNQSSNLSSLKAVGAFIWDLAKILIIALVIIVPFRIFIAEPFVVSGSSMLPNFHDKDYLIVDRLSYSTGQPQRGDVVVLKYPRDTTQFYIKRIVGLPGDRVVFQQGHVYIYNQQYPDGLKLNEPYIPSSVETLGQSMRQNQYLGSDEYFALGDNRLASSDSRIWGILPRNDIVGKVWLRVLPFSGFGLFQRPSY